uniref:Uncharacterized protein n=1 Tax=viral metagenome TaxID=1070528 RepID=A0A6C0BTD4_9ZZZZ
MNKKKGNSKVYNNEVDDVRDSWRNVSNGNIASDKYDDELVGKLIENLRDREKIDIDKDTMNTILDHKTYPKLSMWPYWYRRSYEKLDDNQKKNYLLSLLAINKKSSNNTTIEKIKDELKEESETILSANKSEKISDIIYEAEKSSIIALIMQTDTNLNNTMISFIETLIEITRQGIEACKEIDRICGINNIKQEFNYNIIELLNLGMPLERINLQNKSDKSPKNTIPGSFVITQTHLTKEGLRELNYRELVQLMNCFWNCTNHPLITKDGKNSHIWGEFTEGNKGSACSGASIKLQTITNTAPPLNMIYEKIAKNVGKTSFNLTINKYEKIKLFIDKINIFNQALQTIDIHVDIPSGRFPLCFDFNDHKKNWKQVIESIKGEDEEIFKISINSDFLKDIQNTVKPTGSEIILSTREKKYIQRYKKLNERNKHVNQEINDGIINWTTGFSLYKLDINGILNFNMLGKGNKDEDTSENEADYKYKYIKTGLSGSTSKYLQLAYFCGIEDLTSIYYCALAYLVGCYHHTWYEVTKSAIDFRNDLGLQSDIESHTAKYNKGVLQQVKLNIDTTYWKPKNKDFLNREILTCETRRQINKLLPNHKSKEGVGSDLSPGKNYFQFYRKYLLSLLPIYNGYGNMKLFIESLNITENKPKTKVGIQTRRRSVGGKKRNNRRTRKKKSKFPYISFGGGLI